MTKKYFIITFGCQMNKSDSERIASLLELMGYKPAQKINRADLIVVNMCSIRQSAVDRVYGKIFDFAKLKTQNSKLKTVLTGCILKKDRQKFAQKFNLILNIKDLTKWPLPLIMSDRTLLEENYLNIKPKYQTQFSASIPISNGCNNFCSYCVVPFTRGPLVCRDHRKILKEVRKVIKNGTKEIWLLGQNVDDYQSREINFAKLLKMVNDIPGDFWIRFTSSHPNYFSDELIKTIGECEKVTPYLNLPVQSGDNKILKKMNRPYTVARYKKLVKRIRKEIPGIALSTDIIVGFPGETKKQFENTKKLFKEIKYDMAYIAQYSPRQGTAALKLEDNVSQKEKNRREKVLTKILEKTALENNKKYIGKIINILPTKHKNGFLTGKSFHYKTVKLKGKKDLIGKFIKVKIIDALPWGLKGKLL